MSTSAPQSIADTNLGLTPAELQILRQQQQVLAQQRAHNEAAATRGRGSSRHSSTPSSRAVSAASSGGQGRVLLDPRNLQTLHAHFDNLMRQIQGRIDELEDATRRSVAASSNRANGAMADADAEINRMRRIIAEIDALEADFDRVKKIRDTVKQLKARVEGLDRRLDRTQPSSNHHHHGGGHGSNRHDPRRR